eukprot:10667850-Alexandrium_andersonii.AAC.1
MLVERRLWEHQCSAAARPEQLDARSLSVDASPQLGLEIFGGFCETMRAGRVESVRRTDFALCSLGFGHTTLVDKTMALLWQIWLIAGPAQATLEKWRASVRVIVTDWGTEAGIADAPNLIPQFMEWLSHSSKTAAEGRKLAFTAAERLFPRSIFVPGWNHIWDNLLKAACEVVPWFAEWLASLKDLVRFFRNLSYRIALHAALPHLPPEEAASIQLAPKTFAKWRWGTLAACCKDVGRL